MRPDITLVHRTVFSVKTLVLLLVLFAFPVNADDLAIKTYTSANGLASSAITHVARDSQGFMWFSNREGLSRFDGTEAIFRSLVISIWMAVQTLRSFDRQTGSGIFCGVRMAGIERQRGV